MKSFCTKETVGGYSIEALFGPCPDGEYAGVLMDDEGVILGMNWDENGQDLTNDCCACDRDTDFDLRELRVTKRIK